MRRLGSAVFFVIFSLLATAPAAHAQKRVALVIGNSAYQHTGKLTNPRNDATDISAALKKLGFQVVDGFDLDKAAFDRKVRDFATALQGAEVGLFFFAGHGLQVAGQNYLVPVDAELTSAAALDFEMVRVDVVHRVMEHQTSTNILFLDACRDNPLARNLARAMGTRSAEIGRGFAPVASGLGTLISFSTQPGNVAVDGTGRNSPFAAALVKHISSPNDDLSRILIHVRNDVRKDTHGKQVPWDHSALTAPFYFNAASQAAPTPTAAPQPQLSEAERAWPLAKDTTDIAVLEAFIVRYRDTFYADLARSRASALKQQQVAVATPPPTAPAPVGEPAVGLFSPERAPLPLKPAEERALKPKDSFKECGTCPEMVVVPAGSYTMGSQPGEEGRFNSEGPPRQVTIGRPFAVGKFEVTFAEWDACVAASGCTGNRSPSDQGWGRGKRPVINVSWDDAKEYAAWLSRTTGKTYRLLTEAEWEYAARGVTSASTPSKRYWWGDQASHEYANYGKDRCCVGHKEGKDQWEHTAPVGQLPANAFGLHDTHGNALEWVQDCKTDSYTGAPSDGRAVPDFPGCNRALRGGGWHSDPAHLRSAVRISDTPDNRNDAISFRLARTLGP